MSVPEGGGLGTQRASRVRFDITASSKTRPPAIFFVMICYRRCDGVNDRIASSRPAAGTEFPRQLGRTPRYIIYAIEIQESRPAGVPCGLRNPILRLGFSESQTNRQSARGLSRE